jgi:hypothetical protein
MQYLLRPLVTASHHIFIASGATSEPQISIKNVWTCRRATAVPAGAPTSCKCMDASLKPVLKGVTPVSSLCVRDGGGVYFARCLSFGSASERGVVVGEGGQREALRRNQICVQNSDEIIIFRLNLIIFCVRPREKY